jgi:hypothetical protein
MEIVIGAAPRVGPPPKRGPSGGPGFVEARVLNVRQPRRRRERPPGEGDRRHDAAVQDPVGGRVMVLLVPEGYNIPPDIDSGNYRIFLRFAPRKR